VAVWTTPRTWTEAYLVGSADLNQQLRDNTTALYDAQHDVASRVTQTTPRNWAATTTIAAAYSAGKFFGSDLSWTADGSTYVVEFFCPLVQQGTTSMTVVLIDGTGTGISVLGVVSSGNASVFAKYYYTPVSGPRTLNVVGVVDAGTGAFQCGNGGTGLTSYAPAYLRVTGAPI
jgi:hypothetical protein